MNCTYKNLDLSTKELIIKNLDNSEGYEFIKNWAYTLHFLNSQFLSKSELTEQQYEYLGRCFSYSQLNSLNNRYNEKIRNVRALDKKKYKNFANELFLNTDVRLGNFLINDFLRKIKEKSIETKQPLEFWNNPRELHKLLYNKPISDERLAEIKQQSQNRKKKEHEHQKYIKSLKDKNIEPITDQFIKDLDLFDSSEQRMGVVYDYAKSYKKFKNDNNTVQLDYMLQEHFLKEVFSDFKKVYVYIKRGKTSRWGGEFDRIDLDVMELIYQDMKQIMDSKKV